jgi:hypothetical protein
MTINSGVDRNVRHYIFCSVRGCVAFKLPPFDFGWPRACGNADTMT